MRRSSLLLVIACQRPGIITCALLFFSCFSIRFVKC
uniref:Uncharacterized protein n=1 Tax=Anguilla anguilla TaxID=7936 RepID=A0A0E9RW81_ANGAN